MSPRRMLAALCFAFLVPAAAAGADAPPDWRIEFSFEGDGGQRQAELRLHGDRLRLREEGVPQEVIVSPDAIYLLDAASRSYSRFSFAQIEATLGAVYGAVNEAKRTRLHELEAVVDSLGPPERDVVVAEIARLRREAGPDPSRYTLEPGATTARIAGQDAELLRVQEKGTPVLEAWITRRIPVATIQSVFRRLGPLVPPGEAQLAELLAVVQRLEGFPLKVLAVGEKKERLLVTKVENRRYDDADFAPPPDWKKSIPSVTGGR